MPPRRAARVDSLGRRLLVARRVHRPIFQDVAHRVERLAGRREQVSMVTVRAVRDDRPAAVHGAVESARHPRLEALHCARGPRRRAPRRCSARGCAGRFLTLKLTAWYTLAVGRRRR